jgi:hypothetical protein
MNVGKLLGVLKPCKCWGTWSRWLRGRGNLGAYVRMMGLGLLAWAAVGGIVTRAADPISPEQFDKLRQQIKPQPGESRFWEIPWLLSLDEALAKAAAEGKPIFVWSGAGGPPHTVC